MKPAIIRHGSAVAIFLLLTLLTSQLVEVLPAVSKLSGSDADLYISIMEYALPTLFSSPTQLYDMPVHVPYKRVLGLHDTLLAQSVVYFPFRWIGLSQADALRLLIYMSFFLTGWCTWVLACHLTGSFSGSLVAGIIAGFAHYRFSQIVHVTVLWAFWIPLALFALLQFLQTKRKRWLLLLGSAIFLQFFSCIYNWAFLLAMLAILVLFSRAWRKPEQFLPILAVVFLAHVLLAPAIYMHATAPAATGAVRTPEISLNWSADLSWWWSVPGITLFHILPDVSGERALFPGYAACLVLLLLLWRALKGWRSWSLVEKAVSGFTAVLALQFFISVLLTLSGAYGQWLAALNNAIQLFTLLPIGAVTLLFLRSRHTTQTRMHWVSCALAAIMIGAFFLSLGEQVRLNGLFLGDGIYTHLFSLSPALASLRTIARWKIPFMFALAALSALALQRFLPRVGRKRYMAVAAIFWILFIDYLPFIRSRPYTVEGNTPAWTWIKNNPDIKTVLHLPIHKHPAGEARYMLSRLYHKKPIINGYVGTEVGNLNAIRAVQKTFPDRQSISYFRSLPVSHLILHRDQMSPERQQYLMNEIADYPALQLVNSFEDVLIVAIDRGGSGRFVEAQASHDSTEVRFTASLSGASYAGQTQIRIFEGRTLLHIEPVSTVEQQFRVPLPENKGNLLPRNLYIDTVVLPAEGMESLNLSLQSEADSQRARILVNGAYYPAKKGYNLFHFSENGTLAGEWHFQTAWYAEESEAMLERLRNLQSDTGYLVLVTRSNAGQNLQGQVIQQFESMGMKKSAAGNPFRQHAAVVHLTSGKVLAEQAGRKVDIILGRRIQPASIQISHLREVSQ